MNYNDYDAFADEDTAGYHPDADHEVGSQYNDYHDFYGESTDYSDYNDDMDGDHDSAMTSAGWGTDEDYGYYGDDIDAYENYYGEDY